MKNVQNYLHIKSISVVTVLLIPQHASHHWAGLAVQLAPLATLQ